MGPLVSLVAGDPRMNCRGQVGKRSSQHVAARDDHIVMSGLHCKPGRKPHHFLKPTAHAITLNSVAMLFGDGEACARWFVGRLSVEHFDQNKRPSELFALPATQKLGPTFQPPHSFFLVIRGHLPAGFHRAKPALCRQALAATCATGCENLLTASCCHAGTETVTTLANKLGRLKCTLCRHLF